MARKCDICGKAITFGNNVSHSNRKSSRTWKPNLQSTSFLVNGKLKKVRACTRCIKKGKILRTA